MTCSFLVKNGKITNLKYEKGDFDCSGNQLTSLEGSPKKIKGSFICYNNKLTSLNGCPKQVDKDFRCSGNCLTTLEGDIKEVKGDFTCSNNKLINLKGCPESIGGIFDCLYNPLLVDISDLTKSCEKINIECCSKITKFPKQIEKTLTFYCPTKDVRERIKKQPFYEVVTEDEISITVRQKTIGEKLLDDL